MPDQERKDRERRGPSSQPVDEGLEGAIFDERDTHVNDAADVRDLDAAAAGKGGLAPSRSGERQDTEGRIQDPGNDRGEETPPETLPS